MGHSLPFKVSDQVEVSTKIGTKSKAQAFLFFVQIDHEVTELFRLYKIFLTVDV